MADGRRSHDAAEDAALAAIIRSTQDAVVATSVEGLVTVWNEGATALFGSHPADMLGRDVAVTFPPEAAEAEQARHASVAAGVGESGVRCARLRQDGARIELVMSMLPVRDPSGEVVGVATISRPLSEVERSNERLTAVFVAAPDAMICVDGSGLITVANAHVAALFGYERNELIGRPAEVLVPDLVWEVQPHEGDLFFASSEARPMGSEVPLVAERKDGTSFPAEVSLSALGEGKDRLVIAAVRDVTDARAVEAYLRENELRFRQLADNVDTVFTLRQISPENYLYISPGFETLTGYTAEEAGANPSMFIDVLVHPEDRAAVSQRFASCIANGRATAEYRLVRKDGAVRWVRSVITVVPNSAGEPQRIVGMTDDVTERVVVTRALAAAEAEARAASDAKNDFLSRMSHELRTPMNAVLGFGQVLELDLGETRHGDSIQHVLRAGRHLLALINDVLDFSRIEAGEMSFSLEPVPVSELVEEVCRLMQPIADSAGVTLHQEGGDPCFVVADVQRLRQILLNLVGNAVKYNRPGGRVWLGCLTEDGRVKIEVGDDGPGIDQSLQHRLFTPFDRLGAESTSIEGTGVGLAISRGLAELMGGELQCRSDLGRGAVFSVSLRAATWAANELATSQDTWRVDRTGPVTVDGSHTLLYIEDNVANVALMDSVVSFRPEWTMVHAALGRLGLELARAHRPALILLDLHLPDLHGLEVLLALREDPELAKTPVVVISADVSMSSIRALKDAGAARYLTKPLDVAEVLKVLDGQSPRRLEEP